MNHRRHDGHDRGVQDKNGTDARAAQEAGNERAACHPDERRAGQHAKSGAMRTRRTDAARRRVGRRHRRADTQPKEYSRYSSTTHKQVYLYGGLDTRPTEFIRNFGMAWGMGGWLLFPFLQKIGPQAALKLKQRVAAELKTTFASHYAGELSLDEALQPEWLAVYGQRATGAKYLINPNNR